MVRSQATGKPFPIMLLVRTSGAISRFHLAFAGAIIFLSNFTWAVGQVPGFYALRRIIIADTEAKTLQLVDSPGQRPIVVAGVPVLENKDFLQVVNPYLGQEINNTDLLHLGNAIVDYAHRHDRPAVTVNYPTQRLEDVQKGVLRVVVKVAHYSAIEMRGNRYFSRPELLAQLGVKPGDEVRLSSLDTDVNWTNTNPYRLVQVLINTANKPPGEADLDIGVVEQRPFRLVASYDNTGNQFVGVNHYTAAVQFGNLWGRGDQATYQYTTTDQIHEFQSHNLDYRLTLPWHGYLVFDAAYSTVNPNLSGTPFTEQGKNYVGDLRYSYPRYFGHWQTELLAGIDFKEINNQLQFGGISLVQLAPEFQPYDVCQFAGSETLTRRDPHGIWSFVVSANYSPGGVGTKNSQKIISLIREGAVDHYVYGTVLAQRLTTLPRDFQLYTRGFAQLSSANLVGSEQLGIGGQSTVRGYPQAPFSGDQGWIATQEVQSPAWWHKVPFTRTSQRLQSRLIAFIDAGRVYYKHPESIDIPTTLMAGTGVGARSNLGSNFSLQFDYGWQLRHPMFMTPNIHSRGDIRVSISY
jgi:hemolysin activation/secretion protein